MISYLINAANSWRWHTHREETSISVISTMLSTTSLPMLSCLSSMTAELFAVAVISLYFYRACVCTCNTNITWFILSCSSLWADVKLASILSKEVLYSWGGHEKDLSRKVILISTCVVENPDSLMNDILMVRKIHEVSSMLSWIPLADILCEFLISFWWLFYRRQQTSVFRLSFYCWSNNQAILVIYLKVSATLWSIFLILRIAHSVPICQVKYISCFVFGASQCWMFKSQWNTIWLSNTS